MNAEVEKVAVDLLTHALVNLEKRRDRARRRYYANGRFGHAPQRRLTVDERRRERSESNREHRLLNPEYHRARGLQWGRTEAGVEARRRWQIAHRDEINDRRRARHAANPDRERERDRDRYHRMTAEQKAEYAARKAEQRRLRRGQK